MAPQVPWPPIDINTAVAVTAQLYNAVSLPGRTGVVAELESRLAEFFGVRHAVVTSSGTAALHSAYAALGLADGVGVEGEPAQPGPDAPGVPRAGQCRQAEPDREPQPAVEGNPQHHLGVYTAMSKISHLSLSGDGNKKNSLKKPTNKFCLWLRTSHMLMSGSSGSGVGFGVSPASTRTCCV